MFKMLPFFLVPFVISWSLSADCKTPKYNLTVELNPANRSIDVEVEIENLTKAMRKKVFLNEGFRVTSPTGFIIDKKSNSPAYVEVAKKLVGPARMKNENLKLRYSGRIDQEISGINTISADRVELALYSGWYPILDGGENFEYDLTVKVPKTLEMTSNGREDSRREDGEFTIFRFKSIGTVNDIVVLGAPGLQKKLKQVGSLSYEVFYPLKSKLNIDERLTIVGEALDTITKWYGTVDSGLLRFVFSPRGEWGYSRLPLFVVSNERAEKDQENPLTKAEDIQGNIHEMSHFWWQLADPNSTDDWINEGLAEYTSFAYVAEKFGEPVRKHLLRKYLDHIAAAKENEPVQTTTASSKSRYLNRYEKTTVLFCLLEKRFGKKPLLRSFEKLYHEFKGTRKATTAKFLSTLKTELGPKAADFASARLSSPWNNAWTEEARNELL